MTSSFIWESALSLLGTGVQYLSMTKSLQQERDLHSHELAVSTDQHFTSLSTELLAISKEADRDVWEQRNNQFNQMLVCAVLMFGVAFGNINEGTYNNDNITDKRGNDFGSLLTKDGLFVLFTGASIGSLFICIVSCLLVMRRMSNYMIERSSNLVDRLAVSTGLAHQISATAQNLPKWDDYEVDDTTTGEELERALALEKRRFHAKMGAAIGSGPKQANQRRTFLKRDLTRDLAPGIAQHISSTVSRYDPPSVPFRQARFAADGEPNSPARPLDMKMHAADPSDYRRFEDSTRPALTPQRPRPSHLAGRRRPANNATGAHGPSAGEEEESFGEEEPMNSTWPREVRRGRHVADGREGEPMSPLEADGFFAAGHVCSEPASQQERTGRRGDGLVAADGGVLAVSGPPLNFGIFYRDHCTVLAWVVTYSFVVGVLCAWTSVWLLLWNQFPHFYIPVYCFGFIAIAVVLLSGRLEKVARRKDQHMASMLRRDGISAPMRRPPPSPTSYTTPSTPMQRVPSPPPSPPVLQDARPARTAAMRLKELNEVEALGLLREGEFDAKRSEILEAL